ncbi:MAG: amidohydrolase family protein, partial [Bryobacteraceae bacterium]
MNRRTFLSATSAGVLATAAPLPYPIIDTHIHLFDPTRPEGVPWPPKDNKVLYQPALPDRYRKIAVPLGVKGAIKVEASPWIQDNQWVLDVVEKAPLILGVIGNLEPGKPGFRQHLERLHRNPLFLGIRYGNLWDRNLGDELKKPGFVADAKVFAETNLTWDIANPNASLLVDVLRLTDLVPTLRVVVDHLPQAKPLDYEAGRRGWDSSLRELAKRQQIYFKVSEVFRTVDGKIPTDLAFYRPKLDEMWELFGEDRLLYGSDWPNSDNWKPYP